MNLIPEFTVVIPAFNAEATISQSIESVLHQIRPINEIIVIDDGSTDSTASIVKSFQKLEDRIRYYFQENCGVSSARNYGVSLAKSENVLFLDSDDVWLRDKLTLHYEHLKNHPNCIGSFTNYFSFDESNGNIVQINNYKNKRLITGHDVALNLSRINGSSSSFMGKKSHLMDLKGFNPKLKFGEDLDLWVRYSSYGNVCDLKKVCVGIRANQAKAKGFQTGSRWNLSELYFQIWSENKIEIYSHASRRAARKILRVDFRRNIMHPMSVLREYTEHFMRGHEGLFKDIFFGTYGFYLYLVADLWMEFDLLIRNKRR